jgi:hypothetical protein
MAFGLSIRRTFAARSNGRAHCRTNAALFLECVSCLPTALGCQLWEAENSVCRRFSGSSDARQVFNICRIDYGD